MGIEELRASPQATITIKDAAAVLGINTRTLTSALSIHGGDIRAVRVGRRVIIPRDSFLAWLDGADHTEADQTASASAGPDATAIIRAKLIELLGELESVA
ncbi:hypothetical protein GCM10009775_32900 [Microbacterium aoyamense]|uniref:Helix-turn-helix domain-containing protein n=1 Tax=Microbacterium aoyamense TaxID=344166 RepID=A0ABP5B9S9_9MICO|nr:helix-turn-helix domain-containing protein [Microbacterium aoyamense]